MAAGGRVIGGMRVLDLFSGIGGFSLGLERAGMQTVAFVENDPKCRAVLRKHWPDVPIYDDVRTVHGAPGAANVICGGFPCQPFSSASRGRRAGTADDRYLWPSMLRLVSEIRPAWVCAENVTHLDGVALEHVVSDLDRIGYEVETFEIPAAAVGCDHRRARLWILGHSDGDREPGMSVDAEVAGLPWGGGITGSLGTTYEVPGRMDRLQQLGNAVVPDIPEIIGRAIMAVQARHVAD